ncbi:MAG: DNA cytosine methyltransferase [Lachnospiraceae bacterium]|nr:DNA cytosine methyltransferase [Lachnospiraceae bacterium]
MYKTMDLFAGAGGLSYGFEMTNKFQIVVAAEKNVNARKTYKKNHKRKDKIKIIEDVIGCNFAELNKEVGGIDIIIGGPPCQGFSNANRQKNHIISMNNSLVKEYFRAVKEIKPKAFVMENVSMLASETHRFYDSGIDHEMIMRLGIKLQEEELVIAKKLYNNLRVLDILKRNSYEEYEISSELFQLLNVLYKNRNNDNKLKNYIEKNGRRIVKEISHHEKMGKNKFPILNIIENHVFDDTLTSAFEELLDFLNFQKAFILKKELDDNQIIYKFEEKARTGNVVAKVHSYSVIQYVKRIVEKDYEQCGDVVNSLWYGVPQDRKRYIVFGIRKDILGTQNLEMPNKPKEIKTITVNEAIMDLVNCQTTENVSTVAIQYGDVEQVSLYAEKMREGSEQLHNHIITKSGKNAKERFAKLMEGQNFHDLEEKLKSNYTDPTRTQNSIYLRLEGEKPSGTVINVRKSMWIHPKLNRAISVREVARLQSFPDRFIFEGTKDSQYQQVGNAVPPLMAKGLAEWLYNYLPEKK